jgi:HEAT repeat protein
VNAVRPLLHNLANSDPNPAVRRLAIVCLRNGSAQRDTMVLLHGLAESEDQDEGVRAAAKRVAAGLRRKAAAR